MAHFFRNVGHRDYFKCSICSSIMLHPKYYLSPEEERARYEKHNNNPEDIGYQRFVAPIVTAIKERFAPGDMGLDFGAGTVPVITKLLHDAGYSVQVYDPYFHNNLGVLQARYDYIACCEVVEHFHHPVKDFELLRSLLQRDGVLYCKTDIYMEEIDFAKWYYKNDPTHVFFYHEDAFRWIQQNLGFSKLTIQGRLISFML